MAACVIVPQAAVAVGNVMSADVVMLPPDAALNVQACRAYEPVATSVPPPASLVASVNSAAYTVATGV